MRYGQGSGWTTTIALARVAEPGLLDQHDLALDVEALVVLLLPAAGDDQLAANAALRGRRREIGRDRLEGAVRSAEPEVGAGVLVAERRELAILHLEAPFPEPRPDVFGSLPVAFGADEAVTEAHEMLDVR
jgi:hypothetical protein